MVIDFMNQHFQVKGILLTFCPLVALSSSIFLQTGFMFCLYLVYMHENTGALKQGDTTDPEGFTIFHWAAVGGADMPRGREMCQQEDGELLDVNVCKSYEAELPANVSQ